MHRPARRAATCARVIGSGHTLRRVAITGLGVVSPLGNGAQNFFERLVQGNSGVTRLPEDFHPRLLSRVVAPVSFDGTTHFGVARLRMLDRVSQFALVA